MGNWRIFAGNYTGNQPAGIDILSFDSDSGLLSVSGREGQVVNPSYQITGRGTALYSVAETEVHDGSHGGGMAAFRRGDGIELLGKISTGGRNPCHLCLSPDGRYIVCANYSEGTVTVASVREDGGFGEVTDVRKHEGSGPVADRQEKAHAHWVGFSPLSGLLYAVDLGTDTVYAYQLTEEGKLHHQAGMDIRFQPGDGPRHMVFSKDGTKAWVCHELSNHVSAIRIHKEAAPEILQSVTMLPANWKGESSAAAIRLSEDECFLYASNRGHDSLAIYEVSKDGTLELTGFAPTGGQGPRDFAIDPTGQWILVAHQYTHNVTVHRRDNLTGMLEMTEKEVVLHQPVCLCFDS